MRLYCNCEWNDKGSVLTLCAAHQHFESTRCAGFEREIDRLRATLQNIAGHLPALRMIDAETRSALGEFAARAGTSAPKRHKLPVGECATCDHERAANTDFHPSHDASDLCESGKHSHCSCDTCF